jgi:FkbM family methyltransferase
VIEIFQQPTIPANLHYVDAMLPKAIQLFANVRRLSEIIVCKSETPQWLPIALGYLGLKPPRFPYDVCLRSGQEITLQERTDIIIFWLVFVRHHYPVRKSDYLIIDLGANVGLFTLYAARQAPQSRIVAVEPFPGTRQRLQSHIVRNQLQGRVTVFDFAIGEEHGSAEMDSAGTIPSQYRRIDSASTAALNTRHRGAVNEDLGGVSVLKRTLSELLDLVNEKVDLLKVNIHGSEYPVLMSTPAHVLRRIRRIAVQYHELPALAKMGKAELFAYLEGCGFRLLFDRDTHRGAGLALLACDK